MRGRTGLAVLAALLGGLALWQLFPRHDRAADLGQFRLTRAQAIEKARSIARVNGYDTTKWTVSAEATEWPRGAWVYRWRFLHREPSVFNSLISPFVAQVTLRQPDGERFVGVTLSPEGKLVGFGTATRTARGMEHMHPTVTMDAQAEGVLAEFLGDQARYFVPVNRGVAQSHRLLYSWEYNDPADSPHVLRFEASFSEQRLVRAELSAEPSAGFMAEIRRTQFADGYIAAIVATLVFIAFGLAFPSFFRALVRKRLSGRRLAGAGAIAFVVVLLTLWGSRWLDHEHAGAARNFGSSVEGLAGQFVGLLFTSLAMVLFYGAGRALLRPEQMLRWFTLEALLDRRLNLRLQGSALLNGVLCGVGLAALPYLIAPVFPSAQAVALPVSSLYSSKALAAVLVPTAMADIVGIVLLAMPIVRWTRPGWLGIIAYSIGVPVIWFVLRSPFDDWTVPGLAASLLFAAGLWLVECEYGALGALVAGASMLGVWTAATFWVQPASDFVRQGWWAMAPFAAIALAGAVLMRAGATVDTVVEVDAMRSESAVDVRPQRERLASEFDVARRAQQAMLPNVPQEIDGVTFSAVCIPAREVGGDLYDFYPTGDSRYALGVADVSGKGVPASLYMTLTKGFLAAAGRDSDNLLVTLSELNSHLHIAGKRKIFVTMALAFFSPGDRRIELARAGHNPPLWRKAGLGQSEYLTPPGMGLGLTSRLLFERALRLQEIQLMPGDAFVLYSDGITEAMNEAREQFGEDRLQAVVDTCDGQDAQATEKAILQAVRAFIGSAPPHDDMTLFVVRV